MADIDVRQRSLGQVAIVTGSARGIGGAIARRLASEVEHVVVSDLDEPDGRAMADRVAGLGCSASFVRCAVGSESDVRALFDHASVHGRLDVLVNNAGYAEPAPYPDGARWRGVIEANLVGLMVATELAVAAMRDGGGGRILNVSSVAGIGLAAHQCPVYAATKAAVNKLTASLAPLADSAGIAVTAICPDYVATERLAAEHAALSVDQRRAIGMPDQLVSLDRVADAAVDLLGDPSLAGRVLTCPHDAPWRLLDNS